MTLIYPSLLFKYAGQRREADIGENVALDIKLAPLIGEKAAILLRYPCDRSDSGQPDGITARQLLFKSAIGDGEGTPFLAIIERLKRIIVDLTSLRNRMSSAKAEIERDTLFTLWAASLTEFYNTAAQLDGDGDYARRFHEFWNDQKLILLSEEVKSKLSALAPALSKLLRVSAATDSVQIYLRERAEERPFYDRLAQAFESLGFDASVPAQNQSMVVPPIMEALAALNPEAAAEIKAFGDEYRPRLDSSVTVYADELDFIIAVASLTKRLKRAAIPFSYPKLSEKLEFRAKNAYDISLLLKGDVKIIPNELDFSEGEGFYFLTGANGGGKTTYIRTAAISLLLGIRGCPIPCDDAVLYPFRRVFTHFPSDERFEGSGRLVEEEARMKIIKEEAEKGDYVFLNETYSGTEERKASDMTLEAAKILSGNGAFGVYVTHFHEMNDSGIPMLNVLTDGSDENIRTYKVVKAAGVHSSYARDILRKYGLTREQLEASE